MSVVCAKIYPDHITIASDSGVYTGDSVVPSTTIEKVLHIANDFIVGVCGDVSETNLMKWFAEQNRPKENTEHGIFHFMSQFFEFCTEEKSGFMVEPDDGDSPIIMPRSPNEYLIVYEDKVYCCIGPQVHGITEYAAIGAGSPYALTALSLGHDCREAVEIASKLCVYVHTPVREFQVSTQDELPFD